MKKIMTSLLLLLLSNTIWANATIHTCVVEFSIGEQQYWGKYEINEQEDQLKATYKSPFTTEIKETTNVLKIVYDQQLLKKYFIGNYRKQMAEIGQFDPAEVHKIIQYGIEMNGNSAKAQILVFYDSDEIQLSKIVYPSYYPMKCPF